MSSPSQGTDYRTLWPELLKSLSATAIADEHIGKLLPAESIQSSWMGYPPASEEELSQVENRIGVKLPPSYRSFLAISNGWRYPSYFVYDLMPASKIGWFRDLQKDWIDAWSAGAADAVEQFGQPQPIPDEEYFVYGPGQDPSNFREEHWRQTLAISEDGDSAILLLNPKVVTADGEWEAWFFANWIPGAERYRSFWEMMQAQLANWMKL